MNDDRFKLIMELYRREEMFGFVIYDILTALIFSMAGWLFLSIIPLAAGLIMIFIFRNFRMNKPRGYFIHLLYHFGYFNPDILPPGSKINRFLYE